MIRHGQASFFAKDYDRLSDAGKEQARCLGRYWSEAGVVLDEVIVGPRERHRSTAKFLLEAYRESGRSCPCVREEAGFDEHQLELLLREKSGFASPLPSKSKPVQDDAVEEVSLRVDEQRAFRDRLEAVTRVWLQGGPGTERIESWTNFQGRVRLALSQVTAPKERGRHVAVFTSGGVIGVALQKALECSDAHAMALSRRIRNGSLTEFVFSGERFTLDSFNALPHLPERRLWTYL